MHYIGMALNKSLQELVPEEESGEQRKQSMWKHCVLMVLSLLVLQDPSLAKCLYKSLLPIQESI